MDLTEGAVKAIQEPVKLAESLTKVVEIKDYPGDPTHKIVVQSGKYTLIDVPPPQRAHQLLTLADLMVLANRYKDGSIWYLMNKIVLLLDDNDRREFVVMPLELSTPWKLLMKLQEHGPLTQKDTIRLLKQLGLNAAVIAVFRKLDFESRIRSSGQVDKGRETMGKSIEAQVQGTAELPEEVCVSVPIYITPGERQTYTVRLTVDYDVAQSPPRILIEPEPDVLEEIVEQHMADIRERLEEELPGYQIYHGCP